MKHELKWIIIETISAIIGAFLLIHLFSGCAAAPLASAAAGYFTSGGVTLYKSAKETGPKAEFVLVKIEANHIVYQAPVSTPCAKCK